MNKNRTELIEYAIMPRHEMETVSNIYDELLLGKTRNLFSSYAGYNCREASVASSLFLIIENHNPHLIISEFTNKGLERNAAGISKETVNNL